MARKLTSNDVNTDDLSKTDNDNKLKKKKSSTKITEDDLEATKIVGIVELAKEGKQEELLNSVKVLVFPREDDVDILECLQHHLVGLPTTTLIEISHRQDYLTTLNALVKMKDSQDDTQVLCLCEFYPCIFKG